MFYPEVVETLMSYGLHCIGCHISGFETLEQGCMGHGIVEEDFEELLTECKEVIKRKQEQSS